MMYPSSYLIPFNSGSCNGEADFHLNQLHRTGRIRRTGSSGMEWSTVGIHPVSPAREVRTLKRELDTLITQMHSAGIPYADALRQFKKRYILEVLAHHKGNQCKAATELGMHRNTLSRTLAELDMDSAQIRKGMRRPVMSERPAMAQRMAMGQRPRMMIAGTGRQA
jgi:Fis family transcriptional regulator